MQKKKSSNKETESLSSILRAPVPCCNFEVKVTGYTPTNLSNLVRGHCSHFSCNQVYSHINWASSGPINYGKLSRPYCLSCFENGSKRYLDLYFYVEITVTDNSDHHMKIIAQRENCVRLFGMSVHKFLIDNTSREYLRTLMERLIKKCTSESSGSFINLCAVPVASESVDNMEFHLFGHILPLSELVR